MENQPETLLYGYVITAGRHKLLSVTDEPSPSYRAQIRHPAGSICALRKLVSSRRHARRWAMHHRHRSLLEDLDRAADLGRAR